ncbi:hypothetical protein BC831DRAFT_479507 [Entophlyctis helioformis]|nr:hypothetical protein BC831DRAFT_479507 [Entophlyctis helioformis]
MSFYDIEHSIATKPATSQGNLRFGQGQRSSINPDLGGFMGPESAASAEGAVDEAERLLTTLSLFEALRERRGAAGGGALDAAAHSAGMAGMAADQSVLDALISQLMDEANANAKGTPPASKAFVAGLERLSTVAKDSTCHICLEMFQPAKETVNRLPCTHIFHNECIKPWLDLHNSCPACRKEYPTDDPAYEKRRKQREAALNPPAEDSEEEWDPFYG